MSRNTPREKEHISVIIWYRIDDDIAHPVFNEIEKVKKVVEIWLTEKEAVIYFWKNPEQREKYLSYRASLLNNL